MTYYYNGEALEVPFGKCMADVLEEKGVTWEQQDSIFIEACRFICCDEFEKAFGGIREENIDFGTEELLGLSVLIPTEMNVDSGIFDHDWSTFRYCPYCGKPLKARLKERVKLDTPNRCCLFCKHAKVGSYFEESKFPCCGVHSAFYGRDYVCDDFEMMGEDEE